MQNSTPRHAHRILLGLILAATVALTAQQLPAQGQLDEDGSDESLLLQPALDRDEILRLLPDVEKWNELTVDEIYLPLDSQRRRQRGLSERLNPRSPVPEGGVRITPLEGYLDYDDEDDILYGPGHKKIRYGDLFIEADTLILDARLREVQAEGNIVLRFQGYEVRAESIRYNISKEEGVAFNVSGEVGPIFFRTAARRDTGLVDLPQFQRLSSNEAIFRDTDVTSCDFKVPHYFMRGREIVVFPEDRVFIRSATLYVNSIPVLYLPFYSRSMVEGSPWFLIVGVGSRTGTRVRLGYQYRHVDRVPSFENDGDYEKQSEGVAQVWLDYLTRNGPGEGLNYRYQFDYQRHKGQLQLYALQDRDRDVVGPEINLTEETTEENDRWRASWQHRTRIVDDLHVLFNVDAFSDPDIFYDVLDHFNSDEAERERVPERRARAALTWVQDMYVARIMADLKDRVGIDRYNDFTNPRDDNRDFDIDPVRSLEDTKADGLGNDRWSRVARRAPQIDLATRWLSLADLPVYYTNELHFYNALDKALNVYSRDDDDFVKGVEYYQSILAQFKLSQRVILLSKLGVGVGGADRQEELDLPFDAMTAFPYQLDGLTFIDDKTFLAGTRKRSFEDIQNAYAWFDSMVQLNANLSDSLNAWLRWRYRHTTEDFIGDFYASLGNTTFRGDLYNYRIREHWAEYGTTYRLAYPLLVLYAQGGVNLTPRDEIYSKEELLYQSAGFNWSNQRQTLTANGGVYYEERQIFDPSDPLEETERLVGGSLGTTYTPIHNRWYTTLAGSYSETLNKGVERISDRQLTFFTDEDPALHISALYGRELGPKWNTEVGMEWDSVRGGLSEIRWLLQRDLHDAIASVQLRLRRDESEIERRDDNSDQEVDVRFGLKLKIPHTPIAFGQGDVAVLAERTKEPALAY